MTTMCVVMVEVLVVVVVKEVMVVLAARVMTVDNVVLEELVVVMVVFWRGNGVCSIVLPPATAAEALRDKGRCCVQVGEY